MRRMAAGGTGLLCELTAQLCAEMEATLDSSSAQFNQDNADWLEHRLGPSLGPYIGKYSRLYTEVGVQSRQELEDLFQANFRSTQVQDAYEELVGLESRWDQFMQEVEGTLVRQSARVLKEQETVPNHLNLTSIRNETVRLEDLADGTDYLHLILLRHFA